MCISELAAAEVLASYDTQKLAPGRKPFLRGASSRVKAFLEGRRRTKLLIYVKLTKTKIWDVCQCQVHQVQWPGPLVVGQVLTTGRVHQDGGVHSNIKICQRYMIEKQTG